MPGTVLLREGAPGDSMMVVSKGSLACHYLYSTRFVFCSRLVIGC